MEVEVEVEVEVKLPLMVSRSVCLGVGPPFGAHEQMFSVLKLRVSCL
jgi:hypothetical protein